LGDGACVLTREITRPIGEDKDTDEERKGSSELAMAEKRLDSRDRSVMKLSRVPLEKGNH